MPLVRFLLLVPGLTVTALPKTVKTPAPAAVQPYPYSWSTPILTSTSPSASPTAFLDVFRTKPCGGGTSFASTTTINLPVDCLGASSLTTSVRFGKCPLGLPGAPLIVDTVTAWPSTEFGFTCSPTPPATAAPPQATVSHILTDITRVLPLPTLASWQSPPETPTAFSVIHHPDGTCRVVLGLEQVDKRYKNTRERVEAECLEERLRPTVYRATVTEMLMMGCDGCEYIRGGRMTTSCPRSLTGVEPGTKTVSLDEVRTRWGWGCLGRE